MKHARTEILIETRERTLLRWIEKEMQMLCAVCGSQSSFILPERAALETGTSVRDLFRLIENAAVHFIETADGLTLVCRGSLAAMDKAKHKEPPAIITPAYE